MYKTEVNVVSMTVEEWLTRYCDPERFVPLCKECPDYAARWSCPPGVPDVREVIGDCDHVEIIGVKVIYDEEIKVQARVSVEEAERLQQMCYGTVKHQLLEALLTLEQLLPKSRAIMAGRCEVCETCTRPQGKACRCPEKMRYSYSGLGFNLVQAADEILGMPLLWASTGLPDYHVAIASFVYHT